MGDGTFHDFPANIGNRKNEQSEKSENYQKTIRYLTNNNNQQIWSSIVEGKIESGN